MPSLRTLPADLRTFAKYHLKRRVFDYPARETELGVVELPLDVGAYARALASTDRFTVHELSRVEYREREYPILRLRSRTPEARACVVVLAGVHGNERAGILSIPEIVARVAVDRVRLIIVTPVNPVGAAELSRYNADGYDVNRDFVRFDTVEARVVRDVIAQERPDFIVSLHEGPQDATFMFTNRWVERGLAERLLAAMERGGAHLARRDYFGRRLRPPGLAAMSRATWLLSELWARALQMKATGMYADDRRIPEITLESSWRSADRAARVQPHVDLVCALIDALADDR